MKSKWQLSVAGTIALCAFLILASSAGADWKGVIASGDWDDASTWSEGNMPNPAGGDVIGLNLGDFSSYITSSYIVTGAYGPGFVGANSSLIIKNGGSLTCDGTSGWIMGNGPDNVGKLIIEAGGAFHQTGGYAMFCSRPWEDFAGTGIIIVKSGGTFTINEGTMLYLGLSDTEGASDYQHGVFQVVGGGATITVPQFRAHQHAEVIASPTANGTAGLSTIQCGWFVHRTGDASADTKTTLTVAPNYVVSNGDSWNIAHASGGIVNQFATIQTIPSDMTVTVDQTATDITATVTGVPAAPTAPSGVTAFAGSTTSIDVAWTDNSEEYAFKVERKEGAGDFAQVALLDADVVTFADSGLTVDTDYTYRVTALGAGGQAVSGEANASTPPDVAGMAQADAETAITGAGFTVGEVSSENSDTAPAGTVISMSLVPGTTTVDLVVSLGPAVQPDLPVMGLAGLLLLLSGVSVLAARKLSKNS